MAVVVVVAKLLSHRGGRGIRRRMYHHDLIERETHRLDRHRKEVAPPPNGRVGVVLRRRVAMDTRAPSQKSSMQRVPNAPRYHGEQVPRLQRNRQPDDDSVVLQKIDQCVEKATEPHQRAGDDAAVAQIQHRETQVEVQRTVHASGERGGILRRRARRRRR